MSYPFNYPTPQNANVQIFNAGQNKGTQSWVKPQGASFVWFTLIGAGGAGDATYGSGGSGAVTNCMMPAFLIPDELQVQVGKGGTSGGAGGNTLINYVSKGTYNLLTANGGSGGATSAGGVASTSNYFSAAGFFQSVAGQAGVLATYTASTTTFLSGGTSASAPVFNYGYTVNSASAGNGYFQMQPIIVGTSSCGNSSDSFKTGIGCGGSFGFSTGCIGGDGLVVIISW